MIILKVDGDGTLSIQDPMYDEINRYDAYFKYGNVNKSFKI